MLPRRCTIKTLPPLQLLMATTKSIYSAGSLFQIGMGSKTNYSQTFCDGQRPNNNFALVALTSLLCIEFKLNQISGLSIKNSRFLKSTSADHFAFFLYAIGAIIDTCLYANDIINKTSSAWKIATPIIIACIALQNILMIYKRHHMIYVPADHREINKPSIEIAGTVGKVFVAGIALEEMSLVPTSLTWIFCLCSAWQRYQNYKAKNNNKSATVGTLGFGFIQEEPPATNNQRAATARILSSIFFGSYCITDTIAYILKSPTTLCYEGDENEKTILIISGILFMLLEGCCYNDNRKQVEIRLDRIIETINNKARSCSEAASVVSQECYEKITQCRTELFSRRRSSHSQQDQEGVSLQQSPNDQLPRTSTMPASAMQ